jgi:endonuclease I
MAADLQGDTKGWNREHLWPKSYGVGYTGPDFSDLHHLRPADWGVNAARGNKLCKWLFWGGGGGGSTFRRHPFQTSQPRDYILPPPSLPPPSWRMLRCR